MMRKAEIKRIEQWINKIDTFKTKGAGTTRLPFSKEEMECRRYLMEEMKQLGLKVTVDSLGNITGRLPGTDFGLAPVWTGSHIDTVLEAGKFDGVSGVVAGLEAVRLIRESGIIHKRDICVNVYTSEESTRFSVGCIGSRAMAGHLAKDELGKISDRNGNTLESLLLQNGFSLTEYHQIVKKKGEVYCAVELHIEQSPNLEKNHKTIGIVDAVCAPSNLIITLTGEQSHAGGTSMQDRQDAFMAASEIALALEKAAKEGSSAYTTGTVGYVEVTPNAVNVIPGKVVMSIDVRDCDYLSKKQVVDALIQKAGMIAKRRKIQLEIEEKCDDVPMKCDEHVVSVIEDACKKICRKERKEYMHTMSGAYHDSLFIGEFAPVGMIFVPSKNGVSHSPAEWTDYSDIAVGTDVLTQALIQLANEEEKKDRGC